MHDEQGRQRSDRMAHHGEYHQCPEIPGMAILLGLSNQGDLKIQRNILPRKAYAYVGNQVKLINLSLKPVPFHAINFIGFYQPSPQHSNKLALFRFPYIRSNGL
jgi:hypothetical protein